MSRSFRSDKRGNFDYPTVTASEHFEEVKVYPYHNSNTCSTCIVNGPRFSEDVRALLKSRSTAKCQS